MHGISGHSIGAYYPLDEGEAKEAKKVYLTGEQYINDGKQDATGSYVYVKAPVKDRAGRVIGIIEIGMVSDTLSGMIDSMRTRIMVEIILMVIIAVFLLNEGLAFMEDRRDWKRLSHKERTLPFNPLSAGCDVFRFCGVQHADKFPASICGTFLPGGFSDHQRACGFSAADGQFCDDRCHVPVCIRAAAAVWLPSCHGRRGFMLCGGRYYDGILRELWHDLSRTDLRRYGVWSVDERTVDHRGRPVRSGAVQGIFGH